MTYVTDQTSQELRAHMRRLKAMKGWHEPLADRLYKEILELDKEVSKLRAAHAHAIDTSPGWLPIESAPKDGTRVLIKADCTVVAGWQNVFDDTFGWVVINDVWVPEHIATHWQPLPAAPSTKEQHHE